MRKEVTDINTENDKVIQEFSLEVKKNIVDIINDSPTIYILDGREYRAKGLRYYSLFRICRLVLDMKKSDDTLDDDNKVITALCTDLDAMCEIMAIILCNHFFAPDDISNFESVNDVMSRNDKLISIMKAKVMNSTFDTNQWAAIIIGAIQSIDLSGFFLLRKSVSTLTTSLLNRKKKQEETASQFMEAQSLLTQQTS